MTGGTGRLLVLGLDGTDFDVLTPYLSRGQLPNLNRLVESGCRGQLRSTYPPMSPPAWTSFMTGVNPGKHGIFDFTARKPGSYGVEFTNARFRRAPTVWRAMSDAGKRVCILSVPMTFPPEELNGAMVSGIDTPGISGGVADRSAFQPPALFDEIERELGGYLISPNLQGIGDSEPEVMVAAALRSVDRKMETARYLYRREPWDCFMVTIGETDALSHRLWRYHDKSSPLADRSATSRDVVDPLLQVYQRVDEHLGRLLEGVPADTTILVMSDHGHAGNGTKVIRLNRWLEQRGCFQFDTSLRRRLMSSILGTVRRLGTKNLVPHRLRKRLFRKTKLAGTVESMLRFSRTSWSRTKAYSEETPYYPNIWLNVRGREPQGIVEPGEPYHELRDRLARELSDWKDPETGDRVVVRVHKREELYSGPYVDRFPDLIIEWNLDQGNSYIFQTTKPHDRRAAIESLTATERARVKSGDHRDHGLVVVSGHAVKTGRVEGAAIIDLAPTMLYLLGIPIPTDHDGRVLTSMFRDDFVASHPIRRGDDSGPDPSHGNADVGADPGYTDEEEDEVRGRLRGLGYLE